MRQRLIVPKGIGEKLHIGSILEINTKVNEIMLQFEVIGIEILEEEKCVIYIERCLK